MRFPSLRRRALAGVLLAGVGVWPVPAAAAGQTRGPQEDPPECPYCVGDAESMQRAGVISHGPIAVGYEGSAALATGIPHEDWRFLETAHFRFASTLPAQRLTRRDRQRAEPLIERLRILLPQLPQQVRELDPYLRLHLLAMQAEELYLRVQQILGVEDADFHGEEEANEGYWGIGPFLGEWDKFDVVLHSGQETHSAFTRSCLGVEVTNVVRWHDPQRHKLLVSIPAHDPRLREQHWLAPHVVHHLTHQLLGAYRHFSYDPPAWLDAGLAHAMERELEPESFTREGQEGAYRDERFPSDWDKELRKMVRRKKHPSFVDLMHRRNLDHLSDPEHMAAWSVTRFLMEEHPTELARFVALVKGQVDEQGAPTGADLLGLQRRALREVWGWTPREVEEGWTRWLLDRRP